MGNKIFIMVLSLSISGTLLASILFLLKLLIKRHFSKRWQYYIWLVVLLRFFLPVTGGINLVDQIFPLRDKTQILEIREEALTYSSLDQWKESTEIEDIVEDKSIFYKKDGIDLDVDKKENSSNKVEVNKSMKRQNNITKIIKIIKELISNFWCIWIIGVLLILVKRIFSYCSFVQNVKRNNEEITEEKIFCIMDDIMIELGVKREIMLYQNKSVFTPMLVGFFQPIILLPDIHLEVEELKLILIHELIHYKRKDILYKWFCQFIKAVHWFNPILYCICQEVNIMCEFSCDEAVIRELNEEEKKQYGNVLINMAERSIQARNQMISMTLVEEKDNLKERLKYIMNYKKISKLGMTCSLFMVILLITGGVALGAKTDIIMGTHSNIEESFKNVFGSDDEWWNKKTKEEYEKKIKQANSVYMNDTKIADIDLEGVWKHEVMMRMGDYLKIRQLYLHGSYTEIIYDMKAPATIELSYIVEMVSGKFKIVFIDPMDKVTNLVEGTASGTKTIQLKKGRNRIKMVGDQAYLYRLLFHITEPDKNMVNTIYDSEEEEKAVQIKKKFIEEIKEENNIEIDKLLKELSELDDEEVVSEVLVELLKAKKTISTSDWKKIIDYADVDLIEDYFYQKLKNKEIIDFSMIESILDYLDEDFLTEYFMNDIQNGKRLTKAQQEKLYPYMDSEYYGSYILKNYVEGKDSIEHLKNYLWDIDEYEFSDSVIKLLKNNTSRAMELFQLSYSYMDETGIYDCLCEAIKQNVKITKADLTNIMYDMEEDDILDILNQLKEKKLITSEDAKDLVYQLLF